MRDAIESLKKKLQRVPEAAESPAGSAGTVSSSGDASNPAAGVGTSGALSVETRYPDSASQPPPRGRVLTRAGDAMRRAAGGMSLWVVGLCALAAALIVALLMRRPRHSA
jgi:hypothetical protein